MNKVYLTTTLPYVNAKPHIGFALELIQADAIARFHRLIGDEVVFNTGTDEHGEKIYKKALEENKDPQKYVDEYAAKFEDLKKALKLSYTNFIRTTDPHHKKAAQEFWKLCEKNGDIYKAKYKIKYCVGCELEKTESELVNQRCPLHPNAELEIIEEENYFFKFSKYQKPLLEFYEKNPNFVVPDFRLNEIKEFVKKGLNDFSISRIKEKMPWGVPVPGDEHHVMYVWFDALVNYISTLEWPKNLEKFKEFWPGIQFAGKDNLRQQTAMWQAMLLSAGHPNSKQIIIHGFITSGGQKMSKSLGNVVDPIEIANKYSTDALRYFLLAKVSPFEDSDFTIEKFEEAYNADLANGLGNLVARVAKLCELKEIEVSSHPLTPAPIDPDVTNSIHGYRFDEALISQWAQITKMNKQINESEIWKLNREKARKILEELVQNIKVVAYNLKPFLPETAEKIESQFKGPKISSASPLFPRI